MIKNIYSLVAELFYVPKKLQFMVTSMMKIKSVRQGDILISDTDSHPDAFIIAEGIFYNCLSTEVISSKVIILYRHSYIGGEKQKQMRL